MCSLCPESTLWTDTSDGTERLTVIHTPEELIHKMKLVMEAFDCGLCTALDMLVSLTCIDFDVSTEDLYEIMHADEEYYAEQNINTEQ